MNTLQDTAGTEKKVERESFFQRLTPGFVRNARIVFKKEGLRGVIRRYGWKAFAAFFIYYLIRDSFLYILLPYLIARGLLF